ncbi:hypothetical protein Salat_1744900 [Sesamum alatum]|uniref:Uncharacterized protein n=1 Tax=Sesamum alatum TaxID=300844 RepID=A0AAE2CKQ3_9LAMI|nr:hypothetical protein Salat_1744900 [Sesamum alatum]
MPPCPPQGKMPLPPCPFKERILVAVVPTSRNATPAAAHPPQGIVAASTASTPTPFVLLSQLSVTLLPLRYLKERVQLLLMGTIKKHNMFLILKQMWTFFVMIPLCLF